MVRFPTAAPIPFSGTLIPKFLTIQETFHPSSVALAMPVQLVPDETANVSAEGVGGGGRHSGESVCLSHILLRFGYGVEPISFQLNLQL